ncbi:hypothetical protein QTP70_025280, partial [Hemibagrus guttatus]
ATSDAQTDINIYTSSVLDHINMCIDNITTVKHVKHFPNQKPWMNSEVCLLLKARDSAFKSSVAEDYSRARANLKRGIRKVKHAHKLRIEEHFHNNSDPRRMWKGIQTITDHKPSIQSLPTSNAFLPDELNHFFARFDKGIIHHNRNADSSTFAHPISLSTTKVHSAPSRVDPRKSAGPDGIPGRVLRACTDQLAQVFTDIFNLSLAQATVPKCLKTTTIIPVPKHSSAECLNNFHRVALTPIVMKCFEKLVLCQLIACLPPTLDPHQFAYRPNRSTEDAISTVIHLALTHLDTNNTYIRMLFIDFSSAFNTVVPSKLITKLRDLAYREEIQCLSAWCSMNNLTLNAMKTKELIVDFRKSSSSRHSPIYINGSEVERVSSFKFLGVHISEDLCWHLNTSTLHTLH